jgi:hypothetical protein
MLSDEPSAKLHAGVSQMLYKKINVELIVLAYEADSVVMDFFKPCA